MQWQLKVKGETVPVEDWADPWDSSRLMLLGFPVYT